MRESLICIGKIGKKGYYFEDTGIQIFSYEELCYYLKRHMICYIHTLPGEDLLVYLRDELGLEKLYKQLIRLTDPEKDQMKYFSALFREGHYFNEDEIRDILDEYRSLMNAPVYRQKKWMGDLLVRSGRSARALESYQEALVEKATGGNVRNLMMSTDKLAQHGIFFPDTAAGLEAFLRKGGAL